MEKLLNWLLALPDVPAWGVFLAENVLLTCIILYAGHVVLRGAGIGYVYTRREWVIGAVTNVLNTVVTYAGFWLWKHGLIVIRVEWSWRIATDFLVLFFAMDLLMYLFHFLIHKTALYGLIHGLHHEAMDPKPIDLFILHPVETLSFGGMWLVLLVLMPFNAYAIAVYLTVNVVFGLVGHLGIEPLPARWKDTWIIRHLGSSTFHHDHHRDLDHNFGFYTTVWDRIFGTLKGRSMRSNNR
ncbi:MAG TPA: sterol desaturase family protein [Puia sp.]|nr:sterol desaturase family protein [Puia sp.]